MGIINMVVYIAYVPVSFRASLAGFFFARRRGVMPRADVRYVHACTRRQHGRAHLPECYQTGLMKRMLVVGLSNIVPGIILAGIAATIPSASAFCREKQFPSK